MDHHRVTPNHIGNKTNKSTDIALADQPIFDEQDIYTK